MNKRTAGILIGVGAVGIAAAAYVPVKVGDTAQQQIELAVASANASQGSAGVEIQLKDYQKNAYDSSLVTRFILKDPALARMDGTAPYLDIRHEITHGFTNAEFKSEIVVTDEMKESLKDLDGKVPLHFDGVISQNNSVLNTYIEGFTLTPDGNTIRMKPGIIRLNYDAAKGAYDTNGIWNGLKMNADGNVLTIGETNLKGEGQKYTELLWTYSNAINISNMDLTSDRVEISTSSLNFKDNLSIQQQDSAPETVHYSGDWSLEKLHIAEFGKTLYDFEPSGFSYSLTGPTVTQMESLMEIAQNLTPENMTPEEVQTILPVFADALNAAKFSLHDLNVVTPEGRINGDLVVSLETNQDELIKALSFPPILTQYVKMESNAAISKSLFNSMPIFATMAMQLNQMGAYRDDDEDMLLNAQMQNGQMVINDVPMQ